MIQSLNWELEAMKDHIPPSRVWQQCRELADQLFALPCYELTDKRMTYEVKPLDRLDPRGCWLMDAFLNSFQRHRWSYQSDKWAPVAKIKNVVVSEIYNPRLVQAYRAELQQLQLRAGGECTTVPELSDAIRLRTACGGPNLNEHFLFHGCSWDSADCIMKEGFDPRLGGVASGNAFGIGSYFTTVASKADFYTQKNIDSNQAVGSKQRQMFVSRVALGEIYEAWYFEKYRRPPQKANGSGYDSVLGVPRVRGGPVDYDEFIVYRIAQAVPQYIIRYEHEEWCACRTCKHRAK